MHSTLDTGWLHGAVRNRTKFPCLQRKQSIKLCAQQHVRHFGCEYFSKISGKNRKMKHLFYATTRAQSNLLIIQCFTRTLNTLIHNSTLSGRMFNQKKSILYIVKHAIMLLKFSLSLLEKLSLKCLGRC